MRILWLTNAVLTETAPLLGLPAGGGCPWASSLLGGLRRQEARTGAPNALFVLSLGTGFASGGDGALRTAAFPQRMWRTSPENEALFSDTIRDFAPDVIHIFGTEFPHTLEMLRAAERANCLDRTLVSIQGLVGVCAAHYLTGIEPRFWHRKTLRDMARGGGLSAERRAYRTRGALEEASIRLARNLAGRTDWDAACTRAIHPSARYFLLNEGMRDAFYDGRWTPDACSRHTLFLPQGNYPVKGMHFALEALALVRRSFPDARLITTGADPRRAGLRRTYYQKYIAAQIARLGLDDAVTYAGRLDERQMRAQLLSANACISPSTIENSPNGVAEAMLLGVPTVASFVGGVPSMMTHAQDGLLYPADEPALLAEYAARIFADDGMALRLSENAAQRAHRTHDRDAIAARLTEIYETLAGETE